MLDLLRGDVECEYQVCMQAGPVFSLVQCLWRCKRAEIPLLKLGHIRSLSLDYHLNHNLFARSYWCCDLIRSSFSSGCLIYIHPQYPCIPTIVIDPISQRGQVPFDPGDENDFQWMDMEDGETA